MSGTYESAWGKVYATDYELRIECDHSRNEPGSSIGPSIVSTIVHVPEPDDGETRIGWLHWRERAHQDPDRPPALQTLFGEAHRLGRTSEGLSLDEIARGNLVPNPRGGPGMTEGQRWRFLCTDCDDTLPARHSRLVPLLEALRNAGQPSVTLAQIAPRLT